MGSDAPNLETQTKKNKKNMKKFISDNMWWIVILALAIGGYALYRVMKTNSNTEGDKTDDTTK